MLKTTITTITIKSYKKKKQSNRLIKKNSLDLSKKNNQELKSPSPIYRNKVSTSI